MKKSKVIKIGKKLQAIRKIHGYTQEKLAEEVECSTRYIGDIEQDRSRPCYEVLVKICHVFNVGMDEIFSAYLDIEDKGDFDVTLNGFKTLEPQHKETINHLIEYFNKKP